MTQWDDLVLTLKLLIICCYCLSLAISAFLFDAIKSEFLWGISFLGSSHRSRGTSLLHQITETWGLGALWLCICFITNDIRRIFIFSRTMCILLPVCCQLTSSALFSLRTVVPFSISQPLYAIRTWSCLFGVPVGLLFSECVFPLIQEFLFPSVFTSRLKTSSS